MTKSFALLRTGALLSAAIIGIGAAPNAPHR